MTVWLCLTWAFIAEDLYRWQWSTTCDTHNCTLVTFWAQMSRRNKQTMLSIGVWNIITRAMWNTFNYFESSLINALMVELKTDGYECNTCGLCGLCGNRAFWIPMKSSTWRNDFSHCPYDIACGTNVTCSKCLWNEIDHIRLLCSRTSSCCDSRAKRPLRPLSRPCGFMVIQVGKTMRYRGLIASQPRFCNLSRVNTCLITFVLQATCSSTLTFVHHHSPTAKGDANKQHAIVLQLDVLHEVAHTRKQILIEAFNAFIFLRPPHLCPEESCTCTVKSLGALRRAWPWKMCGSSMGNVTCHVDEAMVGSCLVNLIGVLLVLSCGHFKTQFRHKSKSIPLFTLKNLEPYQIKRPPAALRPGTHHSLGKDRHQSAANLWNR